MIYFDNAATTIQKPKQVTDAVAGAMSTLGNAGRSAHGAALAASRMVYDTRRKLADFFHAESPSQIAFTSNATESLNIAIKGILSSGDHVITTQLEHNSVLRPLYEMEQQGVRLSIVPADGKGRIRTEDLEREICADTKAIISTHASNLTGNPVDIEGIGAMARRYGLLFIADAAQTAGILPIDVQRMNIDIMCFTGHKGLLGPQGTGGIYVKKGVDVRPLKSGGSGIFTFSHTHPDRMPEALEAGTLNCHGLAGLNAALDYIQEVGIDEIRRRELSLMWRFYVGVRDIPGIIIYGDFSGEERCPIVSLNLGDQDSALISDILFTDYEIAVRSGGHCAPLMHEALGTVEQGAVRFSFSHYNTEYEVDAAVRAVHELSGEFCFS
ncbi:MAG: aminotransferase class V-fold PLP-dependent enzyme [Clostridiales bacterium]|nr:aminotransferase class V-fold PLP-dependent enzyme [Clostridiales bacterium]